AILKFVKVPKRMSSILEGESLLNDASSLLIFRFALIAVATGQFVWHQAALSFVWMLVGGVGIGLLVGFIFMKAHKYLPTDANMDIVLSVVTPYIMYLAAEEAHSSVVLAVVSGGLMMANNNHRFLSSTSRLRGINVWESFCFVLNGWVFMLIGLALPEITAGLGDVSLSTAIGYGVFVTAVLIVGRILSAYGAVLVTLIMRNFITVADTRNPGLKVPLVLGWTGMRGVVSLAAALSIPEKLADGTPFPERNLILFITFVVILLTLLVQGLTLPSLIKRMDLSDYDDESPEDDMYHSLRKQLAEQALMYLRNNYSEAIDSHPALQQMVAKWEASQLPDEVLLAEESKAIYLDIINHQRKWLHDKNIAEGSLDEDIIRKHLRHLDIEEEKLQFV
ncbi:MAG: cation:proton antiporter, partial [Bacteroidota bacterium]